MSVFSKYKVTSGAFGTDCTFVVKARSDYEAAFLAGTMAEAAVPNGVVDLTDADSDPITQAMVRVSSVTKVEGSEVTVEEDDPNDDFAAFIIAALTGGSL